MEGGAVSNLHEIISERLKIKKYIYSDPQREECVSPK